MTAPVKKRLASVSAVFPAYNDGGTIPSMVLTALNALRQVTDDYEVIVTDDGSSDYTALVLDEMAARYPELRVIHHPANRGYGGALLSGFSAAAKEWIFYTDGDAQYNPLELVNLVDALDEGVDIVNGYKIARSDPWIRKLTGRTYRIVVRLLFGIRLRDVNCDFRLIPRKILQAANLESTGGVICLEMVKKFEDAGYSIAEAPVHHYPRVYGSSQFFSLPHLSRAFRQMLRLYWKLVVKKEHLKTAGSR
ncbi:MAG: glycosyltransferase family 2 protein [Chloroflexota bacterium]